MKYEIIRFLFDWYETPLLYLTPIQILTMLFEFGVVVKIVSKVSSIFDKKIHKSKKMYIRNIERS